MLKLIAFIGSFAVVWGAGFVLQGSNQCSYTGANRECYTASVCPTNTVIVSVACGSVSEICCDGIPACQNVDCNNGTCEFDGTTESCTCDPGYFGTYCEFDSCDEVNTTCSDNTQMCNRLPEPDLFNCTCNDGWSGALCTVDECLTLACENGTCGRLPAPEYAECICDDGFSGDACDIDACDPDPCLNGVCNRLPGGLYNCTCDAPFFGDNCTDEICDMEPCEFGATCTSDSETTFTCECTIDYTGDNCSTPVCVGDGSECNFNGTCVPTGAGAYECDCDPGYSGDECDLAELQCGIEQDTRFRGGANDVRHGNPFVVRIGLGDATFCTGVLVEKQYVVTDILCALLANQSGVLSDVIVGDFNVSDLTEDTEVHYGIEEIITNNSPFTTHDDAMIAFESDLDAALPYIGVIKLNDTITKGYAVNNACPPKQFEQFCNATCKIAAFGGINDAPTPTTAAYRQSMPFSLLNDRVCEFIKGSAFPISSGCGLSLITGSGMCRADNGGAVVCQDEETLQWHLQGVIQWRTDPGNERTDPSLSTIYCSDEFIYYADMNAMWSFVEGVINI